MQPQAQDERPRAPLPDAFSARKQALLALWPSLCGAALFRAACYAVMMAFALWAEMRPAPSLPDLVLSRLPYVAWIDRVNYVAWLVMFVPLSVALLLLEPQRWRRYMVAGGLISLARGLTIALTGLGPPDGAQGAAGLATTSFAQAYLELLSPVHVFGNSAIHVYLSKDLFFSGHAATTFLLVLYLRGHRRLLPLALVTHVCMVAAVLLAHLHYSIDIVGAWAVTFAVYCLVEGWPGLGLTERARLPRG